MRIRVAAAGAVCGAAALWLALAQPAAPPRLIVQYPEDGSIFPPDMEAPTFLWHAAPGEIAAWRADIAFDAGGEPVRVTVPGERLKAGEIDPRAVGPTNELPALPPALASSYVWKPAAGLWAGIRSRSAGQPVSLTISALQGDRVVSQGSVRIAISEDPVGAPVFYRDVPLMPSPTEKGVIKPLAPKMLPLLAWRLKYLDEPGSRVVLEGMHTCANCHSFSLDGRTLGMDLDGPHNDKGLYAIVPIGPQTTIRHQDVVSWKKFRNQMERDKRIGFMSQVSPGGRFVVTATEVQYYVANFKDYRFLQAFYPTRGILAWFDRQAGRMSALPGADDPRYVHANAVWSPDGKYLVFVRAAAADAYPAGRKLAEFAGDPNEVQIRYDLYRIPFNGGAGGQAEPVPGASNNGMSNSFPKVSPDGRWIVFVQSRNGQLMRPDGQLYIVPAQGGTPRRMRCNTPRMNSWHSFSPNGRWMVFASKSRSHYTQLWLTHIDERGNDSPAILIENTTAANRAANIPEFVNIPKGGLLKIDAPAAEFYRLYDLAFELTEKGRAEEALAEWERALSLEPRDAKAHNNVGGIFLRQGRVAEAEARFRLALDADPELVNARNNLGLVLLQRGRLQDAASQFRIALELDPDSAEAHVNLGGVHLMQGNHAAAVSALREALRVDPGRVAILNNLAWILAACPDAKVRHGAEAVKLATQAVELSGGRDATALDTLGAAYAEAGRYPEALAAAEEAAALAVTQSDPAALEAIRARISLYKAGRPFRESR